MPALEAQRKLVSKQEAAAQTSEVINTGACGKSDEGHQTKLGRQGPGCEGRRDILFNS